MGAKSSEAEESPFAGVGGQRGDDSPPRVGKAGRKRAKPEEKDRVGRSLGILIRHCFPDFWKRIGRLDDPRDADRCTYGLKHVLCLVVLMFACRISSRRELDVLTDDRLLRDNMCWFSGQRTDTVITSQQMVNVLKGLSTDELAEIQRESIRQLVASKRIPDAYIMGHLAVAVDGTGIYSSSERHCDKCLTQEHRDGSITYMHNVLEAKVLCASGMALSIMSEPVENNDKGRYDKQDCESKAFKRLLPQMKSSFPRQPFAHLLDSLYANGPALESIRQARHHYICNFKRGSIPTLFDEAMELIKLSPENVLKQQTFIHGPKAVKVKQTIRWVNGLEYNGMTMAFIICEETDCESGEKMTFAWLTSFEVDRENVVEITRGGRMRWKIENEGFKEQKLGYELEHFCRCGDLDVMRALYLILQTAHMFMQLLAKSNLLARPVKVLKHLAFILLESLRNTPLTENIPDMMLPPMQVRFAKSDP